MPGGKHAKHISFAVLIDVSVVEHVGDTVRHVAMVSGTRAKGLFRSATDGVLEEFGRAMNLAQQIMSDNVNRKSN